MTLLAPRRALALIQVGGAVKKKSKAKALLNHAIGVDGIARVRADGIRLSGRTTSLMRSITSFDEGNFICGGLPQHRSFVPRCGNDVLATLKMMMHCVQTMLCLHK